MGVFYENVGGFGSSLTTVPFGQYPALLVASPEIARRCPDFITPTGPFPVPFIINEPHCIFRRWFEGYLRERAICWIIPSSCERATIVTWSKATQGCPFCPVWWEQELSAGELVEIPTEMARPRLSAVCRHHKNKWVSPLIPVFMDLCKEAAAQ